nr:DUF4760 domain-containing protein [uncultured Holophaga sp.]
MLLELPSILDASGILVTVVAALLVARQTYAHFIRNRAFAYIERFNHKDSMELRIEVEQWLALNPQRDALIRLVTSRDPKDIALAIKVRTYLNLFQELAVAFEKGMVDRRIFYRNFDFLITSHWDRLEEFIFSYRAHTGDFTLYKRFERMVAQVKCHRVKGRQGRLFIFGYGSLRLPASLHRTLARPLEAYPLLPGVLRGYRRAWDITVPVWVDSSPTPVSAVFLNLVRDPAGSTPGDLLEVSPEELGLLRLRELNYDCMEVTPYVQGIGPLDPEDVVVTFLGQEAHRLRAGQEAHILEGYLELLRGVGDPGLLEVGTLPMLSGTYRFQAP